MNTILLSIQIFFWNQSCKFLFKFCKMETRQAFDPSKKNNLLSIWEATSPDDVSFPSLEGELEADVAIIGGGITGITTAMLLASAGPKTVLIEAKRIGLGTTGNSTGNLYSMVDEHLSSIKKKWNKDVMKMLVQSRAAAIDLVESTIHKYQIECDFSRYAFHYFAEKLDKKTEEFMQEEYEAAIEAGLKASIIQGLPLPFKIERGLSAPGQAQFNPLKYIRGIAKNISNQCSIYENSPVIDFDDKEGIVKTEKGKVKAHHIVMATHTPKSFMMVQTKLAPVREYGLAAELKQDVLPGGIYWALGKEKHSIRSYKANGKNYAIVIGEKFKTGQNENTLYSVEKLEHYVLNHFPIENISYHWGAQAYQSADSLPYIGKYGDKMYIMTGFATDGLTYGTLAAIIVSDLLKGIENSWASMYKADRFKPLKSAKNVIKEQVDNLREYIKDIPGVGRQFDVSDIPMGEGKVIDSHGKKLAVFKRENAQLKIVSAVCTHMKCIVTWNAIEKSWDCPCHGSRFDTDGKVIEGPALDNLSSKTL